MCVQSIKVHKKFTRFLEFSSQVQYISLRMIRVPDYVRSSVTTRFWLLRTYKRLPDKSLYINAIIHTLLVRIILRISLPVLAFFLYPSTLRQKSAPSRRSINETWRVPFASLLSSLLHILLLFSHLSLLLSNICNDILSFLFSNPSDPSIKYAHFHSSLPARATAVMKWKKYWILRKKKKRRKSFVSYGTTKRQNLSRVKASNPRIARTCFTHLRPRDEPALAPARNPRLRLVSWKFNRS